MPVNAFFNLALQGLLTCIYFGSTAAFNAFVGVAVICLGTSYLVPITVSFVRGRREVASGRFFKGKLGYFCNWYVAQLE